MRKTPKKSGSRPKGAPEWPSIKVIHHALARGMCAVIPGTRTRGIVSSIPELFLVVPDMQLVCLRCEKVGGVLKASSKEHLESEDFSMKLRGWLAAEGKKHVNCKEVV